MRVSLEAHEKCKDEILEADVQIKMYVQASYTKYISTIERGGGGDMQVGYVALR